MEHALGSCYKAYPMRPSRHRVASVRRPSAFLMLLCCAGLWPACSLLDSFKSSEPEVRLLQSIYVQNPRLKGIPLAEYRRMLGIMEDAFLREWDIHIQFLDRGRMPIDAYFNTYFEPTAGDTPYKESFYDVEKNDPMELAAAFKDVWREMTLDDLIRSIHGYTGCGPLEQSKTKEELAEGVARCHVSKYKELRAITLEDGQPLLTGAPYEQFLNWEWMSRNQKDYDIVVTNQLIASIETYSPAIHSSLRGGVSTGVTYKSRTQYDGMVVMSTFPLLSDLRYFYRERRFAGETPEARDIAGWYQTHELGHLLLQYDHPIGHPGCSMNFAIGFDYRTWYDDVMKNGPTCKREHKILKSF